MLWGLVAFLLIMTVMFIKTMDTITLVSFEESLKALFETSEKTTGIILLISLIQLCIILFSLNEKSEEVSEELKKAAKAFTNNKIICDIVNIIYKNFPPLIQVNEKGEIDKIFAMSLLGPRVDVDHTGNLSIYDIKLDYREKTQQVAYKDEDNNLCYLTRIEWIGLYGKFGFHIDKVNKNQTVEKLALCTFAPDEK